MPPPGLDLHDLVATPAGVDYLSERHELGLFAHDEYLPAFDAAGLDLTDDPEGPLGRDLCLGVRR